MTKLSRTANILETDFHVGKRTEKILQFGEGNFLRAFFDIFIDDLNRKGLFDGSVVIVQPIAQGVEMVDKINEQDGLYTVVLRGLENKKPVVKQQVVSAVSRAINPYRDYAAYMENVKNPDLRFIVSNTTEAGIVFLETDKPSATASEPPSSFPAKITAFLYERFKFFEGAPDKGFIFIPCELIDDNGSQLKEFVLKHAENWGLPLEFIAWVNMYNHFANTLVDRIVTGHPKDEDFDKQLGYHDELIAACEIFHFFAIDANSEATVEIRKTLPFHEANMNILLTDVKPYKLRKVRILNGGHTCSILAAFLCGMETVKEMMDDPLFTRYLRESIHEEIIPAMAGKGLEEKDLLSFADSVFDRFANPYIKHYLLSIALNSVSKFKARVLPSILDYYKLTGKAPKILTLSFAALIAFYKGGAHTPQDDDTVLDFFREAWKNPDTVAKNTLASIEFWGENLNDLQGFTKAVSAHLTGIEKHGMRKEILQVINEKYDNN
jgi:tagaturonate reductase